MASSHWSGAALAAPGPRATLLRADLENHASARDLHERAVTSADNMSVGSGVSHGAIIHDVGTPVRTEPNVGRAVEPSRMVGTNERLVAGVVAGEVLDLEGEWLIAFRVEVDQLDLVSDFRRGRGGIRRRKPKIAF